MPTETTNSNSLFSSILGAVPVVGGLLEGVGNLWSQANTNKTNLKMMNQQRSWAVEDWNKQNAYNAPSAQMQRFKDAGLNPNLIYGQSSTAAPVRSTETARIQAPQSNIVQSMTSGLLAMYDLTKTQAQTNLIEAQRKLAEANSRLSLGRLSGVNWDTTLKSQNLDHTLEFWQQRNRNLFKDEQIKDNQIDTSKWTAKNTEQQNTNLKSANAKILADTAFTKNQDVRNAIMTSANAAVAAQRIVNMMAEASNSYMQKIVLEQKAEEIGKNIKLKQTIIDNSNVDESTKQVLGIIRSLLR